MLISRGASAFRILRNLQKNNVVLKENVRNSGHACSYRVAPPPPPKRLMLAAEIVQGFAWWWVLWHLWTEPGHVFGEFEYPDARKWTDEELGIPPEGESIE